jgi:hypothetical protein
VRAPCRTCRRESALTRRGLVWWHRAYTDRLNVALGRCRGAGQPPLGEDGPELPPEPGQRVHPAPWERESADPAGTCYLLCFDAPFGHARHYLGWASPGNLHRRLGHHGTEAGANLMWHVAKAGIGWQLVRTWPGDRHLERRLKIRGGHARLCPACSPSVARRELSAQAARTPADPGGNRCVTIGGQRSHATQETP